MYWFNAFFFSMYDSVYKYDLYFFFFIAFIIIFIYFFIFHKKNWGATQIGGGGLYKQGFIVEKQMSFFLPSPP